VTNAAWRIAVSGSHRHVFANPYGMVFVLGCFAAAPGCALMGQPSDAFAWFAGTLRGTPRRSEAANHVAALRAFPGINLA
jgi:hypothetical protein